jgi:hypothetical protein
VGITVHSAENKMLLCYGKIKTDDNKVPKQTVHRTGQDKGKVVPVLN